jgi:hypothetical protein
MLDDTELAKDTRRWHGQIMPLSAERIISCCDQIGFLEFSRVPRSLLSCPEFSGLSGYRSRSARLKNSAAPIPQAGRPGRFPAGMRLRRAL